MALVVKEDVALDPIDIGILSANAIVLSPDRVARLLQEFGFAAWQRLTRLPNGPLGSPLFQVDSLLEECPRIIDIDTRTLLVSGPTFGV